MLVHEKCYCFVMQMMYACQLYASCGSSNAAFCMTCNEFGSKVRPITFE